jgi:hypothetical protein
MIGVIKLGHAGNILVESHIPKIRSLMNNFIGMLMC